MAVLSYEGGIIQKPVSFVQPTVGRRRLKKQHVIFCHRDGCPRRIICPARSGVFGICSLPGIDRRSDVAKPPGCCANGLGNLWSLLIRLEKRAEEAVCLLPVVAGIGLKACGGVGIQGQASKPIPLVPGEAP